MNGSVEGNGAESALERLLAAAAQDPVQRPAFSAALLDSQVYVLGYLDGAQGNVGGAGVAQPGTSVRLLALSDQEGSITPFFTSERMLEQTLAAMPGTDHRFLRFGCRDLFEMTGGSRLVLNPHSDYGKVFLPDEVADLVAGGQPGVETEVLEAEREIMVGAPAHVPPNLPAVLARFFAQRPVVESAYLGWIAHPDGQTGYLMIVVAPDHDQAMAGFGTLQISELTDGHTLDVIVVAPGAPNYLADAVAPFYVRP